MPIQGVHPLVEFILQTISAGALASIATIFFEPKKHRIIQLIQDIDKLESYLNDAQSLAAEYWSKDGNDIVAANAIMRVRTKCYIIYKALPIKNKNKELTDLINEFFVLITSQDFHSPSKRANHSIIVDSRKIVFKIQDGLLPMKPKLNYDYIFFRRV